MGDRLIGQLLAEMQMNELKMNEPKVKQDF